MSFDILMIQFIGVALPVTILSLIICFFVWVYQDAWNHDMNGFLWILIVLFLNIPGFLLYLALRNRPGGPNALP